jgi:hypothetical protein
MVNIGGKGVFFAELDDDFQELRKFTDKELLERTVCYFLLAPSLIIHPAYVWQSKLAHGLVHGPARQLLRPPFAQLELGTHSDINDYMGRRIDRLRRPTQATRELREYEAHGDRLFEEAEQLDIRFRTAVSRDVSTVLRDRRFRDLLYRDLGATDLDRVSLAAQFGALRINPTEANKGREFAVLMQKFVRSANLVSVDTFLRRIYDYGFRELESSEALRRRLLALYYETYADEETIIPATSKLLPGKLVNPYDAEVFWKIMERLFGSDCKLLATPIEDPIIRAIRDLRESSDWAGFVSMYFETMSTIDETLWDQPEEVIATFDKNDPGKSRTFVLRNLWQRRKIDLAGAAFGAVAMSSLAFDTTTAVVASTTGLASFAAGGASLLINIRRFVDAYRNQDLVRIKRAVRDQINRALADLRGNPAD